MVRPVLDRVLEKASWRAAGGYDRRYATCRESRARRHKAVTYVVGIGKSDNFPNRSRVWRTGDDYARHEMMRVTAEVGSHMREASRRSRHTAFGG